MVIPFDFVSNFDDGRYGAMIADMIVAKIRKQGKFVVPDAIDIRDVCNQRGREDHSRHAASGNPSRAARPVRRPHRDLGELRRSLPAGEWDVYDLTVKCADFSEAPQPKMLYEKVNVRTKTVSEIPHFYVAEMLDKLYEREPGGPAPVDQFAEQNWIDNPSLIENGNFEIGTRGCAERLGGLRRTAAGTAGQSRPVDDRVGQLRQSRDPFSPSMPASATGSASCTTARPSPSKKAPNIVSSAAIAQTAPRSSSSSSATMRWEASTNPATW